jgi:hypothetical protein
MTTLTETLVEIADHHTTLYYLKNGSTGDPLPFTDANKYNQLNQHINDNGHIDFSELRPNYQAKVLKRLSPSYENHKYWRIQLVSAQVEYYPQRAWSDMLPIIATVIPRVNILKDRTFTFRVLPILRVVLYPFGWSTWLSLRILDPHNLDQLALLLEALFITNAFQIKGATSALSLAQLMKHFSDGVRGDAFGTDVRELAPADHTLVTTVLAKHDGTYSVGAPQNEAALGRMIEPTSGLNHKKFISAVYRYVKYDDDPLEYMLLKDYSRFVWMEHLLSPGERNRQLLRCYHQNTFRLLIHARHLMTLMNLAAKQTEKPVPLLELISSAIQFFEEPQFRNACFFAFLQRRDVSTFLSKAKKWSGMQV